MNTNENKRRAIFISIVLLVAYCVMEIIAYMGKIKSAPALYIRPEYMLERNLEILPFLIVIMIAPLEDIQYILKSKLRYVLGNRSGNKRNRMKLLIIGVLYIGIAFICKWTVDILYNTLGWEYEYLYENLSILLVTFSAMYVLINSFQLITKSRYLFLYDMILIIINAMFVYSYMGLFYPSFLVSIGLIFAWNLWYFESGRKYRFVNLSASILINASAFLGIIVYKGKVWKIDAWMNPAKYAIREHLILQSQHSLQFNESVSEFHAIRHMFSAIYSYLGMIPLLVCIGAFLTVGIMVLYSRKILTKKRFQFMVGIYAILSIEYIYTFLADLGYVPTSDWGSIAPVTYLTCIGVMIRLLWKRDVSERIVEKCDFIKLPDILSDYLYGNIIEEQIPMTVTTLCYLEQDDSYLMMHRVKKKHDMN